MGSLIDQLKESICSMARYNPEIQVAPACILWPDKDQQWTGIIADLQEVMPELLVLGVHNPQLRTGPGIWLRCAIAGQIEGLELPKGRPPVIYLPGYSRQDLRAMESCPDALKPIAELQYRGTIWSQISAKDWTILAYLKTDQGGLGLDVAQDSETKNAMRLALPLLLKESVRDLEGKHLDKDFFNTLLAGGDPVKDLLLWLDDEPSFRNQRTPEAWHAFVEVSKSRFAFNPEKQGVIAAAQLLANRAGAWKLVWDRFSEAPQRYGNIPLQIRKCKVPEFGLFDDPETTAGWPQWNEQQEEVLRRALEGVLTQPAHGVRSKIRELEGEHQQRRSSVWAAIGEAPLACALEHLTALAEVTAVALDAGDTEDLAQGYHSNGWRADDALLRVVQAVENKADVSLVAKLMQAIYLPWAESSARHLQKIWKFVNSSDRGFIGHISGEPGDCIFFVDGLRVDCAKRLEKVLLGKCFQVTGSRQWSALPSVTGTCKPYVAPIAASAEEVAEDSHGYQFAILDTHKLRKLIEANGYEILGDVEDHAISAGKKYWVEFGDIDHMGHERGWKLSKAVDELIGEIAQKVEALLNAGIKRVRIVTDHGWLFLPGGLPRVELSSALAENKWGRCASLKENAKCDQSLYPWIWNPVVNFALAEGVACFRAGVEYAHGGLSLQECATLHLSVARSGGASPAHGNAITSVDWKGLRCKIAVHGSVDGLMCDLRGQPADASSSMASSTKAVRADGSVSLVVENDELEGKSAFVVLLDENDVLISQMETTIGG